MTQSCDKSPYTNRKIQKATLQHKKTSLKTLITQRLRADLRRSVWVTAVTPLVWLNLGHKTVLLQKSGGPTKDVQLDRHVPCTWLGNLFTDPTVHNKQKKQFIGQIMTWKEDPYRGTDLLTMFVWDRTRRTNLPTVIIVLDVPLRVPRHLNNKPYRQNEDRTCRKNLSTVIVVWAVPLRVPRDHINKPCRQNEVRTRRTNLSSVIIVWDVPLRVPRDHNNKP